MVNFSRIDRSIYVSLKLGRPYNRQERFFSLLRMLLLILVSAHLVSAQSTSHPSIIALRCGKLIDVKNGKVIEGAIVLIDGDRIKSVAKGNIVPPGANVIDLSHQTVLPGLIDCHTHLLESYDGFIGTDDPNIILTVAQMTTAKRALLGAMLGREMLEAGITTVRDLGNSGWNGDIALRDAINDGWIVGPRMIVSTRSLSPIGGEFGTVSPGTQSIIDQEFVVITGVQDALRAVRQAIYDGADCIKVIVDSGEQILSMDELKVIVTEAHRLGRKVAAHAILEPAARLAAEAGVDSIEHGFVLSEDLMKMMAEKKIFLVPTDWPDEFRFKALPQMRNLTPEQMSEFQSQSRRRASMKEMRLKLAYEMGIPIAAGSDIYYRMPGKSRGETSILVFTNYAKAGLTPMNIIGAATIRAAELLGWQDRIGSIEPQMLADVIAVDGDLSKDITLLEKVSFIMKDGVIIKH
jgi:imidazolonepropionase-like amidohydrolase